MRYYYLIVYNLQKTQEETFMWNKRNAKRYIAALLTGLLVLSGCRETDSPQTESSVESTESQP